MTREWTNEQGKDIEASDSEDLHHVCHIFLPGSAYQSPACESADIRGQQPGGKGKSPVPGYQEITPARGTFLIARGGPWQSAFRGICGCGPNRDSGR